MKEKTDKSLILYTSLIFIVAIVMIIVSFFAQTHLDRSKINEEDPEKVSLSNKAAQVSEENMQLVELNKTLKETNAILQGENSALKTENEDIKKQAENYKAFCDVYTKITGGNKKAANAMLQNIYTEDLTKEQKDLYDALVKKVN